MLLLFGVMTWLVIHPGDFVTEELGLYDFSDMQFKVLLLALAAVNFFTCFAIEVGRDRTFVTYAPYSVCGNAVVKF